MGNPKIPKADWRTLLKIGFCDFSRFLPIFDQRSEAKNLLRLGVFCLRKWAKMAIFWRGLIQGISAKNSFSRFCDRPIRRYLAKTRQGIAKKIAFWSSGIFRKERGPSCLKSSRSELWRRPWLSGNRFFRKLGMSMVPRFWDFLPRGFGVVFSCDFSQIPTPVGLSDFADGP